MLINI